MEVSKVNINNRFQSLANDIQLTETKLLFKLTYREWQINNISPNIYAAVQGAILFIYNPYNSVA